MKQILVVDDSATMRRMMMSALRDLKDVKFQEASNGLEAIERLVGEFANQICSLYL
jgi:two-component system chemotaxis response regulator CheY